ncbi:MAG: hypothetical protein JXR81_11070 [Candidatus Goldbacteria bacterium]|nr:hypothetical protein [Candidatus Goldiibacteriota bacterium]
MEKEKFSLRYVDPESIVEFIFFTIIALSVFGMFLFVTEYNVPFYFAFKHLSIPICVIYFYFIIFQKKVRNFINAALKTNDIRLIVFSHIAIPAILILMSGGIVILINGTIGQRQEVRIEGPLAVDDDKVKISDINLKRDVLWVLSKSELKSAGKDNIYYLDAYKGGLGILFIRKFDFSTLHLIISLSIYFILAIGLFVFKRKAKVLDGITLKMYEDMQIDIEQYVKSKQGIYFNSENGTLCDSAGYYYNVYQLLSDYANQKVEERYVYLESKLNAFLIKENSIDYDENEDERFPRFMTNADFINGFWDGVGNAKKTYKKLLKSKFKQGSFLSFNIVFKSDKEEKINELKKVLENSYGYAEFKIKFSGTGVLLECLSVELRWPHLSRLLFS